MSIERLSENEGRRLRAVRLRALRDSPDAFTSTLEEAEASTVDEWSGQLTSMTTFVAVQGGVDVGMVRWGRDADDAGTAWLLSLWVAPEARGQGVADALVDSAIGSARAQGASRMVLDVGDHNARGIAFYTRKGFTPNGRVSHLPPPREHIREHQMELTLAVSPAPRSSA